MSAFYDAKSVYVPTHGWLLYANNLDLSLSSATQQLNSIDGRWIRGPNLFQNKTDGWGCIVQVGLAVTICREF